MTLSLEAVYPAVVSNGSVQYHAPPNIAFIMACFNLMKRALPSPCLPLVGEWIRILESQEMDMRTRYRRFAWVYNAMMNVGIMATIFRTAITHNETVRMWSQWSPTKQRGVLESLRTGVLGPETEPELAAFTWFTIARPPQNTGKWDYVNLLRIARKYGLTKDDFEFFATIESPDGGDPVFYPFHVLSQPQAIHQRWDCTHTAGFANVILKRMRRECNLSAEKAGLGEPAMDAIKVVYWMAHHWLDKVRQTQTRFPQASREEVRFRLLDRWGLPVIPWNLNLFRASLCKKQDHGIAMKFGLVYDEDEHPRFDPVEDFDLSRCTITIDTQATNMGMMNYNKES